MEPNLELLSKMNCFMNVLFIFTILKLRLFSGILFKMKIYINTFLNYFHLYNLYYVLNITSSFENIYLANEIDATIYTIIQPKVIAM
ncbi:hypothetical protein C7M56_12465 [Clostridium botulinum]|uniref:Uncharacterized protein n=1 Tax=Clostridium botulinum TaxID=1491 RepID=A0ABC8CUU3_CLOBO|nr:hypothetical protein C7M56_12465 [Clostridium botulinum]